MDTAVAQTLALDLMTEHGLTGTGWTFDFDRAKRRAGACHWRTKRITLSRSFVELNGEPEVRDTILHEIAHAHVGAAAGHGPVWRKMARSIGCSATRTTTAQITAEPHRYIAECPAGHVAARYRRKPSAGMLKGGYCKVHGKPVLWRDTVAGQNLNAALPKVTAAPKASAVKHAGAPWVVGATTWDAMWGDE